MKSICFWLTCLLASFLVTHALEPPKMDDPRRMDRDDDRHSRTSMIRHLQQHVETLNRDNEDILRKLNNPDISSDEKRRLMSQMDLNKRKMASMQDQLQMVYYYMFSHYFQTVICEIRPFIIILYSIYILRRG